MTSSMDPKSRQWSDEHASAWQDADAARDHEARPAHPEEAVLWLVERLGGRGGRILDLGTGTGEWARRLAPHALQVDAVDVSPAMLALARSLPGGNRENLRWVQGRAAEVDLDGPYDLVSAGDSIHWMDWERLFPRLRDVMSPSGWLVLLGREDDRGPWRHAVSALIPRFSRNRDWEGVEVLPELARRGLFLEAGRHETAAETWSYTPERYLDLLHSRSALTRARMGESDAEAFDSEVLDAIQPWLREGVLHIPVSTILIWGRPGVGP